MEVPDPNQKAYTGYMANNPKRHHYLPQAIQRNFLADGETKLWYYDRKEDTYEQRTPKGIAQLRNLYSYDGVDQEQRYALEKAFSVLEGKAAPAFLKLQKGEEISQEEHTAIAEFVGMQYFRTPSKLEIIKEVTGRGIDYSIKNLRNEIANMTDDAFRRFIDRYDKQSGKEPSTITKERLIEQLLHGTITVNNDKNLQLSTLVDAGTHLGIKFSARSWAVLHTSSNEKFITSDVGIHLTPDGKPTRITGLGPGSPGMAIIFPFADNVALMITSKPIANVIHADLEDALVFVVNSGLARVSGQLYSSDKAPLERLVKTGNLAKTAFRPFFDEEQMQKFAQKHFFDSDSQA